MRKKINQFFYHWCKMGGKINHFSIIEAKWKKNQSIFLSMIFSINDRKYQLIYWYIDRKYQLIDSINFSIIFSLPSWTPRWDGTWNLSGSIFCDPRWSPKVSKCAKTCTGGRGGRFLGEIPRSNDLNEEPGRLIPRLRDFWPNGPWEDLGRGLGSSDKLIEKLIYWYIYQYIIDIFYQLIDLSLRRNGKTINQFSYI